MNDDDAEPQPVDEPLDEAKARLRLILRLHVGDRSTGNLCRECVAPLPCRTRLIAEGHPVAA